VDVVVVVCQWWALVVFGWYGRVKLAGLGWLAGWLER